MPNLAYLASKAFCSSCHMSWMFKSATSQLLNMHIATLHKRTRTEDTSTQHAISQCCLIEMLIRAPFLEDLLCRLPALHKGDACASQMICQSKSPCWWICFAGCRLCAMVMLVCHRAAHASCTSSRSMVVCHLILLFPGVTSLGWNLPHLHGVSARFCSPYWLSFGACLTLGDSASDSKGQTT